MRGAIAGLAVLTAVGGAIVYERQSSPPADQPPVIDLPQGVSPIVDKQVIPYEIEGTSGDELTKDMYAKGPRRGLSRFMAYTEWNVDWHYRFKEAEGTCEIDDASLALRVTIKQYLPLWRGFDKAQEPLRSNWDAFRAALNAHEDQHARHGLDAGGEVMTALLKLPPAKTCPEVEAAADAAGLALVKKNQSRDVAFDQRTNNGMDGMPGL